MPPDAGLPDRGTLKTVVVVNPKAGRRMLLNWYLPQVLSTLRGAGIRCRVAYTRYSGHATRIVERLRRNLSFVTVFGGDGTIREVVSGMAEEPLPVAIIPFGTVNVLAMDLGIPLNPALAANAVLGGRLRRIDVGAVNGQPFLLMVSTGIDALAVHNLDLRAKRYFGQMAYMLSALWSAFTDRARKIRIDIPEQGVRDRGYLAVISNSRYYGGRYRIAQEIRIDDGVLDVFVFKKSSLSDTLRLLVGILLNRHRFMRDVAFYRGTRIEITSRGRVKMQMDGDRAPSTPAVVQVKPRHLPVFVPSGPQDGLEAVRRVLGHLFAGRSQAR